MYAVLSNVHLSYGVMYICHIMWHTHVTVWRIKLLPVTHGLVDTWMLTVKLVYKLSNVPDDLKLKWTTNTHMTPLTLTFNP